MSNYRFIEINDEVRDQVSSPDLDIKEMEYCVLSSQTELREIVATNPKLTDQFARWMSKDVEPLVRAALSRNTSIDPKLILDLSQDSHLSVISAASENPNLSSTRLSELATHRSYIVRTGVAANPNAPGEILEKLAKDSEWGVRRSVAKNNSANVALLDSLSKEDISEIQIAVAENPVTSMSTLQKLWDNSAAARNTVIKNPNCTESFLLEAIKGALQPSEGEDETWDDDIRGDTTVRQNIAERENLSRALIDALINDPSHYVRQRLASNLSLTADDLSKLALDSDESVRQAVVENPNTSNESKAAATLLGLPNKEFDDE